MRTVQLCTLWAGVACALSLVGCSAETASLTSPGDCFVDAPCEDDPSKTCKVPCPNNSPAGGIAGGTGGTGGTSGTGTAGSAGAAVIDVTGSVVEFVDATFDQTVPYFDEITVHAEGPSGEVTAKSDNGELQLLSVFEGAQWIWAESPTPVLGFAYSTYSRPILSAGTNLVVQVVPVEVMQDIATQINVSSLDQGSAHLVLRTVDSSANPLQGVTAGGLSGASVGYDVGPGQFFSGADGTGSLGLAVVLNVAVPSKGTATVSFTAEGNTYSLEVPVAPDSVTYTDVIFDASP
ncbi:MAG: hypothetical protein IPK82_32510 [Polyangiaceae bacterium]|nr:hypothetical protein [Polyangiaceae bacterium]